MMELSFPHLILLPLAVSLFLLFVGWFYFLLRDLARSAPAERTRIYRCAVCEHIYVDSRDLPLARCSRCGCLNEAVRR